MTPRRNYIPIDPNSARVRCPVCHEAAYSRAGIHPQCAVRQADPPRPKPKRPSHDPAGQAARAPEPAVAGVVADPPTPEGRPDPARRTRRSPWGGRR